MRFAVFVALLACNEGESVAGSIVEGPPTLVARHGDESGCDHPRGVAPEPYEAGLPPSLPDYCVFP